MQNPSIVCFGVVPLRRSKQGIEVYVIHRNLGFWELPKGHGEKGETPQKSAERELFEETGLCISSWTSDNQMDIFYEVPQGRKKVSYWAAFVEGTPCVQPEEVKEGKWLPWEEALTILSFKNNQDVLRWAIHSLLS